MPREDLQRRFRLRHRQLVGPEPRQPLRRLDRGQSALGRRREALGDVDRRQGVPGRRDLVMTIVPVAGRSRVAADGGDDPARVETARVEQHQHTAGDRIGAHVADALVAGQAFL